MLKGHKNNIKTMIKKLLFSLILLFTMANIDAAQPLRIDPANWFAGMKDPSLQIKIGRAHV